MTARTTGFTGIVGGADGDSLVLVVVLDSLVTVISERSEG
jgi:hypothetical protein